MKLKQKIIIEFSILNDLMSYSRNSQSTCFWTKACADQIMAGQKGREREKKYNAKNIIDVSVVTNENN